jgi:hypothetical protein
MTRPRKDVRLTRSQWIKRIFIPGAALLFFLCIRSSALAEIVIIANPQTNITHLERRALKSLYIKPRQTWPNGIKVTVTMLTEAGPSQEFCRGFIGKSPAQLKRHWRRQLYIGRALPPVEFSTSPAVLDFVRATPGALGFIATDTPVDGVTVVKITP